MIRAGRQAVGPDKYLGTDFRVFYPEMPTPDQLAARSVAAVTAGANGVNYDNYGLIPEARLDWIGGAVTNLGNLTT